QSTDNNITMQAIREHFETSHFYRAGEVIPFSSERKWGAMVLEGLGTVVLGAPERLLSAELLPEKVKEAQESGLRTLMFGLTQTPIVAESLADVQPLALLEIEDPIRQNAEATLAYLNEQGVAIKVISGDNPVTVSNISRRAGLAGYENYV